MFRAFAGVGIATSHHCAARSTAVLAAGDPAEPGAVAVPVRKRSGSTAAAVLRGRRAFGGIGLVFVVSGAHLLWGGAALSGGGAVAWNVGNDATVVAAIVSVIRSAFGVVKASEAVIVLTFLYPLSVASICAAGQQG